MSNRIQQLAGLGQSVWLDFIRRGHLLSGEFDRLVERGVLGVTSNPTIFQQAIGESDDYDAALRALVKHGGGAAELFDAISIEDIQTACDKLRAVYDRTAGLDGRVSIEVSPRLARDTNGTIEEARRLHRLVARPNVLVKIPATAEGLPAIQACTAEGISINVTLIFSLARYEQVMDSYLRGLEARVAKNLPLDSLRSVASFFVSRVDTKIDKAIDDALAKLPAGDARRQELEAAKGTMAIANARLAYARFQEVFATPRFQALQKRGAHLQRPLWASTSTKNPAYRDVRYVEELIGEHTVNTMPLATIEAFDDHGVVEPRIQRDVDEARRLFARLPELGIPVRELIDELEEEGVRSFSKSFDALLATLDQRRREMAHAHSDLRFAPGDAESAIHERLDRLDREAFGRRLWARDTSLWGDDPGRQQVARNRLGWLESPALMSEQVSALKAFAAEVQTDGFTHAVLLGMGGSSLAPEVLRHTFGVGVRALELTVLDSTSPAAVRAVAAAHDPATTLFLVASKSGNTLEVSSFEKFFWAWSERVRRGQTGRAFVAITDPGSPLEKLAAERDYRKVFTNPPDIGGRYSALSYFGLVPAALLGVDLAALLEHALDEARASGPDVPPSQSFGLELGVALGELGRRGRDKVTFVLGPRIASFGSWAEQLIAESTGKDGKGLVPVDGEPLGAPEVYGADRAFVAIAAGEPLADAVTMALDRLEHAGHPVFRWRDSEVASIGSEFLRWEIATATAGAVLDVDPFDEPNVTEAKLATQAVLKELQAGRPAPRTPLASSPGGIQVEAPKAVQDAISGRANGEPAAWAAALLSLARPGDYFALLAYLHRTDARHERLEKLRLTVRNAARIATTLGYGPRFLHSTGQLHKGGPNTGIFLQLTADDGDELAIPGEAYDFGTLIRAQAAGDYQVLERRGRRVMRVHLGAAIERGLDELIEAFTSTRV